MNDTLLRQWSMLREIPRFPKRISTAALVERLGSAGYPTTQRTVQRDLNKLSNVLPLLSDDAKPQGWSWRADAQQLDLPSLEPQAALVFHLAEKYLQALLPASTTDYLAPWFKMAHQVLDNQGNGLSAWRKKVRVLPPGQPLHPPVMQPGVQDLVTQALLQEKRLWVRYRPRNQEDKEYKANPLGLVVRDHVIYLVCTLRDYDDVKLLALHRIHKADLLDEPARRLKGFDLDRYIKEGKLGWPVEDGKKIKLVANFAKDAALTFIERPLDLNQTVEDIDENTVRLTAEVMNTRELRTWLLGFGRRVTITNPSGIS
jgi:predicted DNA-binding transcriptional regulator YafY